MMNPKKILQGFLIFILLGSLVALSSYTLKNTKCFVFTSVPINLRVTSAEKILFSGAVEPNDLFGPTYFNCERSFPLELTATQISTTENDSLEVAVNRHFFKYLILNFEEVEGKIVLSKDYRLIRPMFQ